MINLTGQDAYLDRLAEKATHGTLTPLEGEHLRDAAHYWERKAIQCAHCNADIHSEYGDPDGEAQA